MTKYINKNDFFFSSSNNLDNYIGKYSYMYVVGLNETHAIEVFIIQCHKFKHWNYLMSR